MEKYGLVYTFNTYNNKWYCCDRESYIYLWIDKSKGKIASGKTREESRDNWIKSYE